MNSFTWIYLSQNNANQLQLHLTRSPVSIVMYTCERFFFKNFGIGVVRNDTVCSDTTITHTSVVVGYGTTKRGDVYEEYWEILNSYGIDWGKQGTIKLARNTAWDQYGG